MIQHEDDCSPEWFGEWFSRAGLQLDVVMGHRGDPIPSVLSLAGLVVLGGEMGAYDDAAYPWLTATKQLIATVVEAQQPFLGICLGHQLAAVALGGRVTRNPHGQAKGLTPVALTAAGQQDELLHKVPVGTLAIQWNSDIVDRLPADSVELATAPDGTVQAARFGKLAWGVQFHPETSPTEFGAWLAASNENEKPDDVDAIRVLHDIEQAEAALRADWAPLAQRFTDIVYASVGTIPLLVS